MKALYVVLLVLALALAFSLIMALMVASDREQQRVAKCVLLLAKSNGYEGDIYSRDAWDTFISKCK